MGELYKRIETLCNKRGITVNAMCKKASISQGIMSDLKSGRSKSINTKTADKIAQFFDISPSELLYGEPRTVKTSDLFKGDGSLVDAIDWDKVKERFYADMQNAPGITEDIVSFEIIGDVAAGYNHLASPDWEGEKIDIPREWLHNQPASDFFCLRVCGDSMYPLYQDGDVVLVKKQSTLNRSGEIGVVIYDDELATLKKIEYVIGENWFRMVPINPNYSPTTVEGEYLEHCRVLGLPVKLIRNIKQ